MHVITLVSIKTPKYKYQRYSIFRFWLLEIISNPQILWSERLAITENLSPNLAGVQSHFDILVSVNSSTPGPKVGMEIDFSQGKEHKETFL